MLHELYVVFGPQNSKKNVKNMLHDYLWLVVALVAYVMKRDFTWLITGKSDFCFINSLFPVVW